MTKTWLWFRIESNTESKNGRKFRPDTETKVSKSQKKIWCQNYPRRSFFERIQGAIIFFRDLLTLNQNQQIFQTIAMSHDLLESRNEVKF